MTAKFGLQAGQRILRDMEEMEKPVIAAVNGFAFGGGCEVALACDIRICSEDARFGQLEINYGVMPGWAGTQRLTKIVGLGRAKDLVLTGRIIEPQEALMMGLVSQVVPAGRADGQGQGGGAACWRRKAPVAMALAKEMVNAAAECSIPVGRARTRPPRARSRWAPRTASRECSAFIEKREPDFKGRVSQIGRCLTPVVQSTREG